jgi:hypothetical protein
MAINRLKTIRPEIEVGRTLSVHASGWLAWFKATGYEHLLNCRFLANARY